MAMKHVTMEMLNGLTDIPSPVSSAIRDMFQQLVDDGQYPTIEEGVAAFNADDRKEMFFRRHLYAKLNNISPKEAFEHMLANPIRLNDLFQDRGIISTLFGNNDKKASELS